MIPILSSAEIREADQHTITSEPIDSIDLMERASQAFLSECVDRFQKEQPVHMFCGTGNNGGDGLAIARLLQNRGWKPHIYVIGDPEKATPDFKKNLVRAGTYDLIRSEDDFPSCKRKEIIIDGLFGSGLSRPLEGLHAKLIEWLNEQESTRVSIDIATGLFVDQAMPKEAIIFRPDLTISFQLPKLSFFLPECYPFVGEWQLVDIGLDQQFIRDVRTPFHQTTMEDVALLVPTRSKFTHKNEVGSLVLVAGSKGKMGAAVLCTRAAFRTGVGLVHVCAPTCGTEILQISIPEAMVIDGGGDAFIAKMPASKDTMAIGPGLGTDPETANAFKSFLAGRSAPVVLDADAINLIAADKNLLSVLPSDSILTPHVGEFRRLVGEWADDFEKLEKLRAFSLKYQVNVVLKGAYSAVCDSKGTVYFNPTGNPAMATAGSGDVLTGIIAALLAQKMTPIAALKLGVYVHGLAGDLAVASFHWQALQASDIIEFIPKALSLLKDT